MKKGSLRKYRSVGLFAGIGGIELGFEKAGISTQLLCEIDEAGGKILSDAFPSVPLHKDIVGLRSIPDVEVVSAGFPCQNLSLVGTNDGIHGKHSGLINEVFRLIEKPRRSLKWVVLENVPFMLWHKKGHAISYVTGKLVDLGFRWAYRVVDTRAFGLPQRRRRVLIVASRKEDPKTVLFSDDFPDIDYEDNGISPCGFYWTEGKAGLGWAVNSLPTIKGGSSIGIPSPPAIWMRNTGHIVTPNICDAERLQGFKAGWTEVNVGNKPIKIGFRWKLVGNAVSLPVFEWLGERLMQPCEFDNDRTLKQWKGGTWPNAAWGESGKVFPVKISEHPKSAKFQGLDNFLKYPVKMLSYRASAGFLKRARNSTLRFAPGF